jgi:hypothetical protein
MKTRKEVSKSVCSRISDGESYPAKRGPISASDEITKNPGSLSSAVPRSMKVVLCRTWKGKLSFRAQAVRINGVVMSRDKRTKPFIIPAFLFTHLAQVVISIHTPPARSKDAGTQGVDEQRQEEDDQHNDHHASDVSHFFIYLLEDLYLAFVLAGKRLELRPDEAQFTFFRRSVVHACLLIRLISQNVIAIQIWF